MKEKELLNNKVKKMLKSVMILMIVTNQLVVPLQNLPKKSKNVHKTTQQTSKNFFLMKLFIN